MKILKKIFGFLVNPFSLTTNGRASNKIFDFLMKYKVKYDANEHREYLKSLGKKG